MDISAKIGDAIQNLRNSNKKRNAFERIKRLALNSLIYAGNKKKSDEPPIKSLRSKTTSSNKTSGDAHRESEENNSTLHEKSTNQANSNDSKIFLNDLSPIKESFSNLNIVSSTPKEAIGSLDNFKRKQVARKKSFQSKRVKLDHIHENENEEICNEQDEDKADNTKIELDLDESNQTLMIDVNDRLISYHFSNENMHECQPDRVKSRENTVLEQNCSQIVQELYSQRAKDQRNSLNDQTNNQRVTFAKIIEKPANKPNQTSEARAIESMQTFEPFENIEIKEEQIDYENQVSEFVNNENECGEKQLEPNNLSNENINQFDHILPQSNSTIGQNTNLNVALESEKDRCMRKNKKTNNKPSKSKAQNEDQDLANEESENSNENIQDELRRSKRTRINRAEVPVYKFEKMRDFNGKQIMVKTLVSTKKTNAFSQFLSDFGHKLKLKNKKTNVKHKIKEHKAVININNNDVSLEIKDELDERLLNNKEESFEIRDLDKSKENASVQEGQTTNLFCFSNLVEEKVYKKCTKGVFVHVSSALDGILKIKTSQSTKTNRHGEKVTYVMQKGSCLLSLEGALSKHTKGDIFRIPPEINYKIMNTSKNENAYLYFSFSD